MLLLAKAFRVSAWTALGKSLILALVISLPVSADTLENPRFAFSAGTFTNSLGNVVFSWFRKLDDQELAAYHSSIMQALFVAENGERVVWYRGTASGAARPVATWPTGGGYCRRIEISVTDYNQTKNFSRTACKQNGLDRWTWYSDK